MYLSVFFLHLSMDTYEPLGCFHNLDTVKSAAVNTGIHKHFQVSVFIFSR